VKRVIIGIAAWSIIASVTWLALEGGYALVRWRKPDSSIAYGLISKFSTPKAESGIFPVSTKSELEAIVPDLVAAGGGMGNVPYRKQMDSRNSINDVNDAECLTSRPNLRKLTGYVRNADFNRFDPPSIFYDADANLPRSVAAFIARYGVKLVTYSTNENGERITLPAVSSSIKTLVIGDSVAASVMLDDKDTIASKLQSTDDKVQYVNLGVNGSSASQNLCRLDKALKRYQGQITKIIYVYCENDFEKDDRFGSPEAAIEKLAQLATANRVSNITVVYAPYIYNVLPQITRFEGTRGGSHPKFVSQVKALRDLVAQKNWRFIDIGDLVKDEIEEKGSDFAGLAMFLDHVHLSAQGISRLVAKLR